MFSSWNCGSRGVARISVRPGPESRLRPISRQLPHRILTIRAGLPVIARSYISARSNGLAELAAILGLLGCDDQSSLLPYLALCVHDRFQLEPLGVFLGVQALAFR